MEQLNNLDVLFLVITGVSALVGIARGMTKELLSLSGWVLAAAALFYLVPAVNPITEKYVANKFLVSLVSGLGILIIFSIIWVVTVDRLASLIRSSKLSALDRIFGFVFGLARGLLIVVLITLMIVTLIPEESKKGVFADSQLFNTAKTYVEPLKSLVPQSWIDSFKAKSESIGLGGFGEAKEDDKSEEKAGKESVEKKDSLIPENPFEAMDSNLEILQKTGEELFNQMVQPKPAAETEGEVEKTATGDAKSRLESISTDLDRLLDVLEDKIVVTDTSSTELKSDSQKVKDKISQDKIEE